MVTEAISDLSTFSSSMFGLLDWVSDDRSFDVATHTSKTALITQKRSSCRVEVDRSHQLDPAILRLIKAVLIVHIVSQSCTDIRGEINSFTSLLRVLHWY